MSITLLPSQIDEFLLVKASEGLSESCQRKYRFNLETFNNWLGNAEVTKLKYIEYLNWLKSKNLSDTYQKSTMQTIKTCMRYLISSGYDFPNPDFRMPRIHKKKLCYLETDQIKALLKTDLDPRELIVIRLLISTGIRRDELCQLNWEDINFKSGIISINHGKGNKFRFVVTDKPTLVLLLKYRNKNNIEDMATPVIYHGDHKRFTGMGLRTLVNRIRIRTGISFTPHALRRTFARQAVINGMGIEWVQQLMGHESLEMTKAYIGQLDILDVAKVYNKNIPLNF